MSAEPVKRVTTEPKLTKVVCSMKYRYVSCIVVNLSCLCDQANLGLQCLEEAESDFTEVLKLEPDNNAAKVQLCLTRKKIAEGVAREKTMFAGMFVKFAQNDQRVSFCALLTFTVVSSF